MPELESVSPADDPFLRVVPLHFTPRGLPVKYRCSLQGPMTGTRMKSVSDLRCVMLNLFNVRSWRFQRGDGREQLDDHSENRGQPEGKVVVNDPRRGGFRYRLSRWMPSTIQRLDIKPPLFDGRDGREPSFQELFRGTYEDIRRNLSDMQEERHHHPVRRARSI